MYVLWLQQRVKALAEASKNADTEAGEPVEEAEETCKRGFKETVAEAGKGDGTKD
jgi:hypothetical protein